MTRYIAVLVGCIVLLLALALSWAITSWITRGGVAAQATPRVADQSTIDSREFGQQDRRSEVEKPGLGGQDRNWHAAIVGVWHMEDQGSRSMTLNRDGTGVIEVTLTGVIAALYARQMRFDLLWSIEQGKLVRECTGGEPVEKVDLVLRAIGRRSEESIVEVSGHQLRTLSADGMTTYTWERIH